MNSNFSLLEQKAIDDFKLLSELLQKDVKPDGFTKMSDMSAAVGKVSKAVVDCSASMEALMIQDPIIKPEVFSVIVESLPNFVQPTVLSLVLKQVIDIHIAPRMKVLSIVETLQASLSEKLAELDPIDIVPKPAEGGFKMPYQRN